MSQPAPAEPNRREGNRSNVMLAATMLVGSAMADVRIRNLSPTGALVEAGAPPPFGTRLILRRFAYQAAGRVTWAGNGRCGVHFETEIAVAEWISAGRVAKAVGSAGQAEVDAIQRAHRAGQLAIPDPIPDRPVAPGLGDRISRELLSLQARVDRLGDTLIADPAIVAAHSDALQDFDLISQTLGAVARLLASGDASAALSTIGMSELRARLHGG